MTHPDWLQVAVFYAALQWTRGPTTA